MDGFLKIVGDSVRWLLEAKPVNQILESFAVFSDINALDAGAYNRRPCGLQGSSKIQGGLAAKLYDKSLRVHFFANIKHIFSS